MNTEQVHKLTVSLNAGADIHASDTGELTDEYSLTMNYTLSFNNSTQISSSDKYTNVTLLDNVNYSGVLINTDFEGLSDNLYPPIMLYAKAGEKVELAFRGGNYEGADEYLIYTTVGWEQAKMDTEPYILFKSPNGKVGYGTFSIDAPQAPGLYEICAWIVPNPFGATDFVPLTNSIRFTLKVE